MIKIAVVIVVDGKARGDTCGVLPAASVVLHLKRGVEQVVQLLHVAALSLLLELWVLMSVKPFVVLWVEVASVFALAE
jgi:hypothetical protein